MRSKRWMLGVLALVAVVAVVLAVRSGGSEDGADAGDTPPAEVVAIKGTDISRVTLSAQAAKRIGIRTAVVGGRGAGRKVIPYDAVLYAADGHTFTYTSPQPLVYVQQPIRVADIRGDRALLSAGPPVGTAVVVVGSQELFGTEYEVEED